MEGVMIGALVGFIFYPVAFVMLRWSWGPAERAGIPWAPWQTRFSLIMSLLGPITCVAAVGVWFFMKAMNENES